MLIGNTNEPGADGKNAYTAQASFLKCENVNVYYGNWVNYHYCQFTNQSDADGNSLWYNSYPWVRVEAGLSNPGYSNARYGHPIVNGEAVVDDNHKCTGEHKMLLKFNQLYGGDQGVYGEDDHPNVTTHSYVYTIQYINDNKVLAETYVESNESDYVLTSDPNYTTAKSAAEDWVENQNFSNVVFGGWVNAGSTKVTEIPKGTTGTVKLYPYFNSPHTARFVDQNGNVLAWCLFHSEKTGDLKNTEILARNQLTFDEGFSLDYWEIHYGEDSSKYPKFNENDVSNFAGYNQDVTIYPVYKYEGDVNLTPVDDNGDGTIDYYAVKGYGANTGKQELVEIPAYVNGKPVTTINENAFSSYDDLHSIRIPGTVTKINSQSFTADNPNQWGTQRDTVTMYYEGVPKDWNDEMTKYEANHNYGGMFMPNWDNCMGAGSRVFFLDENGKVINTMYWELNSNFKWVLHEHAYTKAKMESCSHGINSHHESVYDSWSLSGGTKYKIDESKITNYAGDCDCGCGKRPDREYWLDENGNPITATTAN
jgi:hypothetical protein